jgi:hypothetical protein
MAQGDPGRQSEGGVKQRRHLQQRRERRILVAMERLQRVPLSLPSPSLA